MPKVFNALSGRELKQVVLTEVDQLLALDARFDREDPITLAMVVFTLHVESYPGPEGPFDVQVSQVFKGAAEQTLTPIGLRPLILKAIQQTLDGDLRFGENLTYPKVTCAHRLDIELRRPDGGTVSTTVPPAPIVVPRVTRVPEERGIDLRAAVVQPAPAKGLVVDHGVRARELRLAELRRQIADLEGTSLVEAPPVSGPVEGPVRHRDFDPHTGTGLDITAGFKPSPGPALAGSFGGGAAVGAIQSREAIETVTVGVSHPPLADGGMGAPDAIRREHELYVPETQTVRGQTVDVPSGTF